MVCMAILAINCICAADEIGRVQNYQTGKVGSVLVQPEFRLDPMDHKFLAQTLLPMSRRGAVNAKDIQLSGRQLEQQLSNLGIRNASVEVSFTFSNNTFDIVYRIRIAKPQVA